MMGFLDSLCGCFSPEVKKNIIDYLSSATLNRQLIEEEKCNQENEAPEQSIYKQVKTKSYYFMKLEDDEGQGRKSQQEQIAKAEEEDVDKLEPNHYPEDLEANQSCYDKLYIIKKAILQRILSEEVGHDYSKIYDSQDELNLRIYCRPEIYQTRRFNSYRFSFDLLHSQERKLTPSNYVQLMTNNEGLSHQLLLSKRELELTTQNGVEINHRCYKKILVIQQHEFYAGEKCELVEEGKKEVAYHTVFSVKGDWQQAADHSRGWINLAGLRVSVQLGDEDHSTSLRQSQRQLHFQGYINVDLDITVNANMLKQPIAKQIRVYVQKLVCSLTGTDAI